MDTQEQPQPKRRGRARERVRRRKEREMRKAQARGQRAPRQIRPSGQFKAPRITIPQSGRLPFLVVGAVLLVVAIVFLLGRLRNDEAPGDPNAIWLGTEWSYETHTNDEILKLVQQLQAHRIGSAYVWVSWLKSDNEWAGIRAQTNTFTEVEPQVRAFVQQFKAAYPESTLYAWISVPNGQLGIPERLDDEAVKNAVVNFAAKMVDEIGFDGVHLNIETFWDGDETYLELLRAVRARLGIATPISVAMFPDWSPPDADFPVPPRITPGTVYSKEYKQSIALLADEIVVMAYNTDLTTENNNIASHYSQWMAYQVQSFTEAVAELDTEIRIVIGIPTYDAELAHDPLVENIASAVEGIKLGLSRAGENANYIGGVAIYAYWETDETEWEQFRSLWVGE